MTVSGAVAATCVVLVGAAFVFTVGMLTCPQSLRHDCAPHYLPLAAPVGTATTCRRCGRWWFYDERDNEFGRDWLWRRVRPWTPIGVVAVVLELVARRRGRR